MMRARKALVAFFLVGTVLIASATAPAAAVRLGLKTVGVSTTGSVVYVSVSNSSTSPQSGTVSVVALVGGAPVTGTAPVTLGAGQRTVVAVTFPATPSGVISCGVISDSSDPV